MAELRQPGQVVPAAVNAAVPDLALLSLDASIRMMSADLGFVVVP